MSLGNNLYAKFPPNKIQILYSTIHVIRGVVMEKQEGQIERHSKREIKLIGKIDALNVLKCEPKFRFLFIFCVDFSLNWKYNAENVGLKYE